MYPEKVLKSLCPPVFEFHFLKVSRLGVAKQKVIRNQATGSMDRKFENHEIFQNIDAGEGFSDYNFLFLHAHARAYICICIYVHTRMCTYFWDAYPSRTRKNQVLVRYSV